MTKYLKLFIMIEKETTEKTEESEKNDDDDGEDRKVKDDL